MKNDKMSTKFIKKLGLYMSDDLEYASFVDATTKEVIAVFSGRSFLSTIIGILIKLDKEIGEKRLLKFLSGEKLQK